MSSRKLSNIDSLANRLAEDMRRRGLKSGDLYLSALEAGHLLGVSRTTAHRALECLARRRLVVRQNKSGTFVGPAFKPGPAAGLRTVHLVIPDDWNFRILGDFVAGVVQELPGAGIRVTQVPADAPVAYFQELATLASAGDLVGFLPISCPHEVYDYLAQAKLPAVIIGSPYTENFPVPSIDADQHAHARNLAGYLIDRGHRRVAFVAGLPGRPGTNRFLDGIAAHMTDAGLPTSALIVRFAPSSDSAVALQIKELLRGPQAPTGVITTSLPLAIVVEQAAHVLGRLVGKDVEIVIREVTGSDPFVERFPHSVPVLTATQIAACATRALNLVAQGGKPEPFHATVPVQMRLPQATPASSRR